MRVRILLAAAALSTISALAVPSHAAEQTVLVAGFQFVPSGWVAPAPILPGTAQRVAPALPSFKKGDVIEWTNVDPVPHRVISVGGNPSSFGALPQMDTTGDTSSLSTSGLAVGTYAYGCVIHGGMRGGFILTA